MNLLSLVLNTIMALLAIAVGMAQAASPASGQVSGHVYTAAGTPMGGAVVTLDGAVPQRMRSAADGSYSFDAITPGDYNVVAYKTGFMGEIFNLRESAVSSLRLVPGQKRDGVDFHLKAAPDVAEMNDDALTAAYPAKERLYVRFSSGRFAADRSSIAVVAGDIVTGDPEQVWIYDLKSHALNAVTDKPTPGKSPAIGDVVWVGQTLYIQVTERDRDHRFVIAASPGKIERVSAVPDEVSRAFERQAAMDVSGDVQVGRYILTGFALHGGGRSYSARLAGGLAFNVAADIRDTPVIDQETSTVSYADNGWYGKIMAVALDTRRRREFEVPSRGITLLAVTREGNGFLAAYAAGGPCNVLETADGEDPWLLPSNVDYRTARRPEHVCFVHLPD